MVRPTPTLETLQGLARPADTAMRPDELGSARLTRHSFARSLIRHAVASGWKVSIREWALDDEGCGHAVYRVDLNGHVVEGVVFSQVISEDLRTDRVIAQDWDVTFALVDGEVDSSEVALLAQHVTKQEDGRADPRTLIWGRANRSQRFFNYVVDCLESGQQPEPDKVSDAAYILRSTAFYGNGKWGLRDFDGIDSQHPLSLPYRAQMLAAWLLREFSADLANHCAAARSSSAVTLNTSWRRYLGLGNATGLGMVPYVIRHPQVLDAWVALRELPLANARTQAWRPDSPEWSKVIELLERAGVYFSQKVSFDTAPYPSGPEISRMLEDAIKWAKEYRDSGSINGEHVDCPGNSLHLLSHRVSIELRQVVDSVLVEIDDSLDAELDELMLCVDKTALSPAMTVGELRSLIDQRYSWTRQNDFSSSSSTAMFWFYSANNQEPRRGRRGKDRGVTTEHPVGIARDVAELWAALQTVPSDTTVGDFLLGSPEHWGIVERIQSVAELEYSEARVNPLAQDFLPLDLQRFQLALYGMENYNPQSTDWLRVTLFGGAPTAEEVSRGDATDDWLFVPRPGGGS